jgi:hypothetical protein
MEPRDSAVITTDRSVEPATDATLGVDVPTDGPACNYPTITLDEYVSSMDAGSYPNLPCGGCAPSSEMCGGGIAYDC